MVERALRIDESKLAQRGRSGRFPESKARRILQRKRRKKATNTTNIRAQSANAGLSRSNVDPDAAKRNFRAASLQKMPPNRRKNKAIPMTCTIVSFCFPFLRLRQNLPSFWTVSGNITFRCRALTSSCHSSCRLRINNLPDAGNHQVSARHGRSVSQVSRIGVLEFNSY